MRFFGWCSKYSEEYNNNDPEPPPIPKDNNLSDSDSNKEDIKILQSPKFIGDVT